MGECVCVREVEGGRERERERENERQSTELYETNKHDINPGADTTDTCKFVSHFTNVFKYSLFLKIYFNK